MAATLPPIPHQAPMVDDRGIATRPWSDLFKHLLARVGGHHGKTDDFKSSHASSGYQRLPGGLVLQWGDTGSVNSGATSSVSFPLEFDTACFQVTVSAKANSAIATTATGQPGTGNYSASGFDLYNRTSVALTFNWFAIGH